MALLHQLSEADWFVLKASTTADPVSHRGDPCKDYDIYIEREKTLRYKHKQQGGQTETIRWSKANT